MKKNSVNKKNSIKLSSIDLKSAKRDNINSHKKSKPKNQISIKMLDYMIF